MNPLDQQAELRQLRRESFWCRNVIIPALVSSLAACIVFLSR